MSVLADIRNNTVALLKVTLPRNVTVYNSKISPTFLKNTPSVLVYTDSTTTEQLSAHRPTFKVSATMQIDIVVAFTDTWADDVDVLVEQTINTLMADDTWVKQFTIIDGYQVDYSFYSDAQAPVGTATITISGKLFKAY